MGQRLRQGQRYEIFHGTNIILFPAHLGQIFVPFFVGFPWDIGGVRGPSINFLCHIGGYWCMIGGTNIEVFKHDKGASWYNHLVTRHTGYNEGGLMFDERNVI